MLFVLIVIAHAADNALLDAFGFETDKVKHFSCMLVALGALGVLEVS